MASSRRPDRVGRFVPWSRGNRRHRVSIGCGLLCATRSPCVVAAGVAIRAGVDVSLSIDGSFGVARVANGFEARDFRTRVVRHSALDQCALELAFLRVAFGRVVIRGHCAPVARHRFHDRVLLADQPVRRGSAHSLLIVGDFRICAQLDALAIESERIAIGALWRPFEAALTIYAGASATT